LVESVDDQGSIRGFSVTECAFGEPPELTRRFGAVTVRSGEQSSQHWVFGFAGGASEVQQFFKRLRCAPGSSLFAAQQLNQLGCQGTQDVRLDSAEDGHDLPTSGRLEPVHHSPALSSVAHRPYSCIAWTSRSISSRDPVETTARP